MGQGMGGHHSADPDSEVWLTSPEIIAKLGGWESFDLDVCGLAQPPYPIAKRTLTREQNGLMTNWGDPKTVRTFCNPPYTTRSVLQFLSRMAEHNHGTALVFARTETEPFFTTVWERATAILFIRSRLHFHVPVDRMFEQKGKPPFMVRAGCATPNNSGAPSALVAYGESDADILEKCGIAGAFIRNWRVVA